MSMDLYLWKSPVTDDEEEAKRLVDRYFDRGEQGVFEPSPDIAAAADELKRLYPYWPISGEEMLAKMSAEERGQGVDDAGGGAPHPGVEGGEEPGGAPADDRDVLQLLLCHVGSCVRGPGLGNKRWNV